MPINKRVRDFARTTTIHGLGEFLITEAKFSKAIWGALLLLATAFCIYQIGTTITEYHQGPTSIKAYVEHLDDLPTVYLHLLNILDPVRLRKLGLDLESHGPAIMDHFPGQPVWAEEAIYKRSTIQEILKAQERYGLTDWKQFLLNVTHPWEDLLFFFDDGPLWNSDISTHFDENGISYQLKKRGKNDSSGTDFRGLNGNLIVQGTGIKIAVKDEASETWGERTAYRGLFRDDRTVFLAVGADTHDPVHWKSLYSQDYQIVLKPGAIRAINKPDKPCSSDLYETAIQCRSMCLAKAESSSADCEWFMGQDTTNLTNSWCVNKLDRVPASAVTNCTQECPSRCNKWNYNLEVTIEQPRQPWVYKTWLTIQMSEMEAMVFEEHYTYPVSMLFSNLGGIMSLYLGASLISFGHMMYFWCCKTGLNRVQDQGKEERVTDKT